MAYAAVETKHVTPAFLRFKRRASAPGGVPDGKSGPPLLNANLFRAAFHVAAICGLYLAAAMLVPALVDLYFRDNHWKVFAISAFLTGGLSLLTATATRGP